MTEKKINIVTINLNNANNIRRTIESVVNQTYFDKINYIIIDGGSDDGSVDIINEYSDKLAYWHSRKDNGLYNAMNIGIDACVGEYVLFLNSGDELCSNDVIEKCYNKLGKDIVYGNLEVVIRPGKILIKKYPDKITPFWFSIDTIPHPSSFIKLDLLRKEKYKEDYKIISDWIFFFNQILIKKCSYEYVDINIGKFYLGGISSDEKTIREEKYRYLRGISKKPDISVIIPCYNYSNYITEAVESLKKSTYNKWQCVIINDGSTDNSEDVILKLIKGDDRFIYIKQRNKGLSAARNIGIRAVDTEYIMCLDPDDKISPTYIENGVKYLSEHEDCTLYYGKAKMFWDDGTEKDWNLPDYDYKLLLLSNHIYSSFIYRREDYFRAGEYDEKMDAYEDWDFLIRLLDGGRKVYMTDDVVFYYRRHKNSMDNSVNKKMSRYRQYIFRKNKDSIMKLVGYGKKTKN